MSSEYISSVEIIPVMTRVLNFISPRSFPALIASTQGMIASNTLAKSSIHYDMVLHTGLRFEETQIVFNLQRFDNEQLTLFILLIRITVFDAVLSPQSLPNATFLLTSSYPSTQ